jgi:hypothetical protein
MYTGIGKGVSRVRKIPLSYFWREIALCHLSHILPLNKVVNTLLVHYRLKASVASCRQAATETIAGPQLRQG